MRNHEIVAMISQHFCYINCDIMLTVSKKPMGHKHPIKRHYL